MKAWNSSEEASMAIRGTSLMLLALLTIALPLTALAASIAQITADPAAYDGHVVTVSGTVSALRSRVSHKGNAYETFELCSSSCVHVFTFGHPPLRYGERATVAGTFSAVKHVGRYTFYNEIDTSSRDVHAGSSAP
jgi:hypothetical protein